MKRVTTSLLFLFIMTGTLLAQSPALASIPRWIRFTGQVKGAEGTVGVTFALHKSQNDNAALWTETQNVKLDAEGKYTVLLGSSKPDGVPMELFTSGEAQWLAVHITGQPEQRVLLVSVPYALKAAEAETLAGHSAAEFVTTEKLTTAIKEQVTSSSTSPTSHSGVKANTTNPATTFADNNSTQVVLVTQGGTGAGLASNSTSGYALRATATTGTPIYAASTATTGVTYGVVAVDASTTGTGVRGNATATSGVNYGVFGTSVSPSGYALAGTNSATSGVAIGLLGKTTSPAGMAMRAVAISNTGATTGLQAYVSSPAGTALQAVNAAGGKLISGRSGSGSTEVFSVDGAGNTTAASLTSTFVQAASNNASVYGGLFSGANGGGHAISANGGSANASGVTGGTGIIANGGSNGNAITGAYGGDGGAFYGGNGDAGTGAGVSGTGGNTLNGAAITAGVGGYFIGGNPDGDGLYSAPAPGGTGNAATLDGNVIVTGTLSTSSAVVRIDHPLDPANKYLDQVGVQSSENLNVYTGNVVLGANGQGVVTLPKWFEAVNTDFRYQLTPIGAPASLFISREIHEGQFAIAGGTPGMKVSWTITAVRHDPYSLAHASTAEVDKPASERGRYLHPELYGHARQSGIAARSRSPHAKQSRSDVTK